MVQYEQSGPRRGRPADTRTTSNDREDSTASPARHHAGGAARMVKFAEVWERTSAKGSRYFSGFLGDAQLLMFDAGEREHPTRPGEMVRVWKLMVQERDPSRRPGGGR